MLTDMVVGRRVEADWSMKEEECRRPPRLSEGA